MLDDNEIRPRVYVARIMAAETREERNRILAEDVPEHFRALVKLNVMNLFEKRRRK